MHQEIAAALGPRATHRVATSALPCVPVLPAHGIATSALPCAPVLPVRERRHLARRLLRGVLSRRGH